MDRSDDMLKALKLRKSPTSIPAGRNSDVVEKMQGFMKGKDVKQHSPKEVPESTKKYTREDQIAYIKKSAPELSEEEISEMLEKHGYEDGKDGERPFTVLVKGKDGPPRIIHCDDEEEANLTVEFAKQKGYDAKITQGYASGKDAADIMSKFLDQYGIGDKKEPEQEEKKKARVQKVEQHFEAKPDHRDKLVGHADSKKLELLKEQANAKDKAEVMKESPPEPEADVKFDSEEDVIRKRSKFPEPSYKAKELIDKSLDNVKVGEDDSQEKEGGASVRIVKRHSVNPEGDLKHTVSNPGYYVVYLNRGDTKKKVNAESEKEASMIVKFAKEKGWDASLVSGLEKQKPRLIKKGQQD